MTDAKSVCILYGLHDSLPLAQPGKMHPFDINKQTQKTTFECLVSAKVVAITKATILSWLFLVNFSADV